MDLPLIGGRKSTTEPPSEFVSEKTLTSPPGTRRVRTEPSVGGIPWVGGTSWVVGGWEVTVGVAGVGESVLSVSLISAG